MSQTFEDRYGIRADVRTWLYADAWLRETPCRRDRQGRLVPLEAPVYYFYLRRPAIGEPGLYLPVSCAIAFDTVSAGTFQVTNWNHTLSGGANNGLLVGAFDDTGGSNLLSAVNWNTSEGLTKIAEVKVPSDRWASLWCGFGLTSGTHPISLVTGAGAFRGSALSLTGVAAVDTSTTGSATGATHVDGTLTAAVNTWLAAVVKENAGLTLDSWTNITEDAAAAGGGLHIGTSRGNVSGSVTSTATFTGGGVNFGIVLASFTAAGAAAGFGPECFQPLGQPTNHYRPTVVM